MLPRSKSFLFEILHLFTSVDFNSSVPSVIYCYHSWRKRIPTGCCCHCQQDTSTSFMIHFNYDKLTEIYNDPRSLQSEIRRHSNLTQSFNHRRWIFFTVFVLLMLLWRRKRKKRTRLKNLRLNGQLSIFSVSLSAPV